MGECSSLLNSREQELSSQSVVLPEPWSTFDEVGAIRHQAATQHRHPARPLRTMDQSRTSFGVTGQRCSRVSSCPCWALRAELGRVPAERRILNLRVYMPSPAKSRRCSCRKFNTSKRERSQNRRPAASGRDTPLVFERLHGNVPPAHQCIGDELERTPGRRSIRSGTHQRREVSVKQRAFAGCPASSRRSVVIDSHHAAAHRWRQSARHWFRLDVPALRSGLSKIQLRADRRATRVGEQQARGNRRFTQLEG